MKLFLSTLTLAATLSAVASTAPRSLTLKASNDFGTEIFTKLQQSKSEENVFFSPVSAFQAMTLLAAGAKGSTFSEISLAMKLNPSAKINEILFSATQDYEALMDESNPDKGLTLNIANSVWGAKDFTFKETYLATVREALKAEAQTLDFTNPDSAGVVNAWAAEKTNGKIKEITDPNTLRNMKAMLINASYFKGDWSQPFSPDYTRDSGFSFLKSTGTVKTMHTPSEGASLRVVQNDRYESIELPYGKPGSKETSASMIVIKPTNYEEFMKVLTPQALDTVVAETQAAQIDRVALALPKFSFSAEYDLIPTLQDMGVRQVFTSRADLSALSEGPFAVGLIKQNTFVAVDEKGTEAAAVTTIGVVRTSVPRPAKKQMKVDSPFLVVIKENNTGAVLFVGAIVDPR